MTLQKRIQSLKTVDMNVDGCTEVAGVSLASLVLHYQVPISQAFKNNLVRQTEMH